MKKVVDSIFSCFFVFASVFTGGIALKSFYLGEYPQGIVLSIAVLYLFGIGCMGLFKLHLYAKGKNI